MMFGLWSDLGYAMASRSRMLMPFPSLPPSPDGRGERAGKVGAKTGKATGFPSFVRSLSFREKLAD